jgi:hypothetical protein
MDVSALIQTILATEDLYDIIGTARDAESSVVTKAYRKLALKLHPDKCSLPGGTEAFQKVSNAFSILKDPDQRAHYDRFGSASESVGRSHRNEVDPEELFRQFFREHTRGGMSQGGVHFTSFGPGFSFGARSPAEQELDLPEPLNSMVKLFSGAVPIFGPIISVFIRLIPTPVLVLAIICLIFFVATSIASFFLYRIHYFLIVMYFPVSNTRIKAILYVALIVCGLMGYV